jgi:hypothetical protein
VTTLIKISAGFEFDFYFRMTLSHVLDSQQQTNNSFGVLLVTNIFVTTHTISQQLCCPTQQTTSLTANITNNFATNNVVTSRTISSLHKQQTKLAAALNSASSDRFVCRLASTA